MQPTSSRLLKRLLVLGQEKHCSGEVRSGKANMTSCVFQENPWRSKTINNALMTQHNQGHILSYVIDKMNIQY